MRLLRFLIELVTALLLKILLVLEEKRLKKEIKNNKEFLDEKVRKTNNDTIEFLSDYSDYIREREQLDEMRPASGSLRQDSEGADGGNRETERPNRGPKLIN